MTTLGWIAVAALILGWAVSTNADAAMGSKSSAPDSVSSPAMPRMPLDLDRVTYMVEGAESNHGTNPAMWRTDPDGPQGPMQVSRAAAIDVGDGDRFDLTSNRALGRAYLRLMYGRYGNWPDAVAAYNWGPANVDTWIGAGRIESQVPTGVRGYVRRVLRKDLALSHSSPTAGVPGDTLRNASSKVQSVNISGSHVVLGSTMSYRGWSDPGSSATGYPEERSPPANRSLGVSVLTYGGWLAAPKIAGRSRPPIPMTRPLRHP